MIVFNECCLESMKRMKDDYIDLTISSPPYNDLRNYEGYSFPFHNIARELYRITKKGGVVVWVVGDQVVKGSESGTSFRHALYFMECGFNLHDTMIYEKNGSTFPARRDGNRYTQIFEYMFVFSKGKPKTHNLLCDKKNVKQGFSTHKTTYRGKDGILKSRVQKPVPEFSPRNNIWRFITGKYCSTKDTVAFKHPAIFPEKLAEDHILTWSNPQDIVYDCFGGAGTSGIMSYKNNRKFIMSEISKEYTNIIKERFKERFKISIKCL